MSIIALQNTTAYSEGTDEQRSELVKVHLVECAFNEVGYRHEWYETDADLEAVKKDLEAAAITVVDRVNEMFPLPFDETVSFLTEVLFKRHLLFSSTSSTARLKAISCLIGANVNIDKTTPTV